MNVSPKALGFFYLVFAVFFVFFAIQLNSTSGWSFLTIGAVLLAAFDFMLSLHFFRKDKKTKEDN